MKKVLNIIFVTLGIIFLMVLLVGLGFFLSNYFDADKSSFDGADTSGDSVVDKHPVLSESQEKALESLGIDPASIPTEITSEQEVCFESKLGEERVNEIREGDTPTMTEYFKAKDCI